MWSDCVYIPKDLCREYSPTFPLDMDHFWPHVDNPYMDPYGYGICSKIHTQAIIHQFFLFVFQATRTQPQPTQKNGLDFLNQKKNTHKLLAFFPSQQQKK